MPTKKSEGTKPPQQSPGRKKQSGTRTYSDKSTTRKIDTTGSTGPKTTHTDKKGSN